MKRLFWELRFFAAARLVIWAFRIMPPDVSLKVLMALKAAIDAMSKDEYLSDEGKRAA